MAPGQYLDREKRTKYRLKVIAFDQASENPRSSTGTLVIKVGDINDSRPKFLTPHTKTQVGYFNATPVPSLDGTLLRARLTQD